MDKNDNHKRQKQKTAFSIAYGTYAGFLIGFLLFRIFVADEKDSEDIAEQYLKNFESNHDLNKKVDALIEGFTLEEGSYLLGDEFEEYLGISLDSSKKQRLNDMSVELEHVKYLLDHELGDTAAFETWLKEDSLKEANEIMMANIREDNDLDRNVSLSFEYGKDYGWVVANDYYQIYDKTLNEYLSSYEILNKRSTDLVDDAQEYDNIINGILKSSLCDIVLDENSTSLKVSIPSEVKQLVKKN